MASADECEDGTTPEAFKFIAIKSKNATVNQPDVAKIHTCKKVAKREEMAALESVRLNLRSAAQPVEFSPRRQKSAT